MANHTPPSGAPIPAAVHDVLGGLPGLNGAHAPLHVLQTLQAGASNGEFVKYWAAYKSASSLSPLEQEMVILRLAFQLQAPYVWAHHIEPLKLAGGTAVHQKQAAGAGGGEGRLDTLLTLTDNIIDGAHVGEEIMAASPLTQANIVDAIALVSQYYLFATTTKSFALTVEFEEAAADRLPSKEKDHAERPLQPSPAI